MCLLQPTGKCEAVFDFTAENSGELTFTTGEVIETTDWVNEEWLSGRIGTKEGMFPLGFVKVLVELPKPSTAHSSVQKGEWSGWAGKVKCVVWERKTFLELYIPIQIVIYILDFDPLIDVGLHDIWAKTLTTCRTDSCDPVG